MIMNYRMVIWCIIVAVPVCALIFRAVIYKCYKLRGRDCNQKSTLLFEFGKDTDIFYVPGDEEIPGLTNKSNDNNAR